MFLKAGFVIFSLGLTMAESECLLVPVAVLAIGALMIYFGREDKNDA